MGSKQIHYDCLHESLENTTETSFIEANAEPLNEITQWYIVIAIFLFTIYIMLMVSCFETISIGINQGCSSLGRTNIQFDFSLFGISHHHWWQFFLFTMLNHWFQSIMIHFGENPIVVC